MRYVLRRLLLVPIPLLLVVAFVFVVLRLTGDPVAIYLGLDATPEQEELLRAELHLDQPIPVQFAYFLADLLQGDFGTSIQFKMAAMQIVGERLEATLLLLGLGLSAAIVLGVLGGVACAVWKDKLPDFVISVLAVAGQSMPSFWLGILLIQFFALDLGWLPTSGRGGWEHLVLPTVTLATFLVPNFILVTRISVLETAREQFVVTARARGAGAARALWLHVLPNAINPVVSLIGLQLGRLMGGAVVTETIFAWPGVGRLMVSAIFQRDVPVVIASVFIVAVTIVIANLLVDLVQAAIDPRIRMR
ncbi:peptide/nickel transport system permease protein/glutathione transport system permease protein [Stella humosa]|uniref:Peptide/nickel transport system permease protein/glutathione transport system permease protein n=1 Tax=Stella humosa TaxID=94 RepID=A0A3N1LPD4_9PROT|nr:ABC transporter permease [Stella humosa]ROP91075.1 peptide/nickel transport system permease protein/glutathione transport system permease protein [Stella humosa]BBK34575.1 glutathione ABC transporter permease [Stella humosa]